MLFININKRKVSLLLNGEVSLEVTGPDIINHFKDLGHLLLVIFKGDLEFVKETVEQLDIHHSTQRKTLYFKKGPKIDCSGPNPKPLNWFFIPEKETIGKQEAYIIARNNKYIGIMEFLKRDDTYTFMIKKAARYDLDTASKIIKGDHRLTMIKEVRETVIYVGELPLA